MVEVDVQDVGAMTQPHLARTRRMYNPKDASRKSRGVFGMKKP